MFPYGCDNYGAVDCTRLAETADIISLHGVSPQTLFRYTYSIGRYGPHKTFANLEYYWNAPEGWSGPTEAVSAAAGERNLWQGVALGLRVFQFYGQNDTFVSFPSRDQSSYNNLADFETDYSVLLPWRGRRAAHARQAQRRSGRFGLMRRSNRRKWASTSHPPPPTIPTCPARV